MFLKVNILEVSSRSWEGKEYRDLLVRFNGRIIRFGVDRDATADFKSFEGKDCEIELSIIAGKYQQAFVTVKSVR